jgi:hypothetical protein
MPATTSSGLCWTVRCFCFSVLTANVADFDILLQLLPAGKVLFYQRQ